MNIFTGIRGAAAVALLVAAGACGGTPTEPDPIYELKTENYGGTLAAGGSAAFRFTVVNPGPISITITSLNPAIALPMRLDLGYWEAPTETCVVQRTTSTAVVNATVSADPTSDGEYCVGIPTLAPAFRCPRTSL